MFINTCVCNCLVPSGAFCMMSLKTNLGVEFKDQPRLPAETKFPQGFWTLPARMARRKGLFQWLKTHGHLKNNYFIFHRWFSYHRCSIFMQLFTTCYFISYLISIQFIFHSSVVDFELLQTRQVTTNCSQVAIGHFPRRPQGGHLSRLTTPTMQPIYIWLPVVSPSFPQGCYIIDSWYMLIPSLFCWTVSEIFRGPALALLSGDQSAPPSRAQPFCPAAWIINRRMEAWHVESTCPRHQL